MSIAARVSSHGCPRAAIWLFGVLSWLVVACSAAATPHSLWQLEPIAGPAFTKTLRPGMHPLHFDERILTDWPLGEDGELALPGGRTYRIRAERTETHSTGNRSWVGKFDVEGRTYVAVLTYGAAGLVGEVRTPNGPILLVMEDSQGVLIDTSEAGWRLPDLLQSDAMVQSPYPVTVGPEPEGASSGVKSTPSPQSTIDVLIAYTPALVTRAGSTAGALLRLDQLIATANQAYVDSEVAITLRLVHAVEVAYAEADDNSDALDNLTNGVGVLGPAKGTLRDRYGADIVALVRPFNYPAQAGCGVAWIGGYGGNGSSIGSQSTNGFAVISDGSDVNNSGYYCQNATFPHELGHNMGAMHDRQTVTAGGTSSLDVGAYAYSYGYVHDATWSAAYGQNDCNAGSGSSCFGTIMSYLTQASELKFSNSGLSTCPGGLPCGTVIDNVALTLNNTRAGVAAWRPTKVPFTGVQSGSGQAAPINSAFAQLLRVTIRDALSQVVPGVTVTFSVPASGASATLNAASAVTDLNGVVQVSAIANATAGSYSVVAVATSGKVASPFVFNLSNTAGQSATLTVVVNGGGTVTGGGINCPSTCITAPPTGTLITLTAAAGSGAVFTGWLGSGCTGVVTCVVSVDVAKTVSATFGPLGSLPPRIDVDLNGRYDPLTDGLLIFRYMSGSTGTALMAGATGPLASRTDPSVVLAFLDHIAPQLDIDGNGRADAATDGVMIVRYLFGLRGAALIQGAIGVGATRTTASQIASYLAGLLP